MNKTSWDTERVAAIELRLSRTSAGPWISMLEGRDHTSGSSCIGTAAGVIDLNGASDFDIDFIANARQDIPFLISELQRLIGLVEAVGKKL